MNPLFSQHGAGLGMTSQFQPQQAPMQLPNYSAAAPKDFGSRFRAALPDILMGIGTSLATNNWANAGKFALESRQRREQEAKDAQGRNVTMEWLKTRGANDLIPLVASGEITPMQAIQMASKGTDAYKAMSPLGKIRSDYEAGLITKEQADALMNKETAPRGAGISIGEDGQLVYNIAQDQKNAANSLNDERAISASATKLKDTISVMREALKNAGYTGVGGQYYDGLDQILGAFGGGDGLLPGSPAARSVIKSGGMKFVLDNVQSTKGAISNKEMELFQQAAPGLTQTPQGNKVLLDIAEKVADRQQMRLAEMEKWRAAKQGSLDGFEPAWAQYVNENPILSQDMFLGGDKKQADLPQGVTEEEMQFTMQKHGLTREQVLERHPLMPRDLLESANTQPRDLLAATGPAQSAASMPVNSLHAATEAFSDGVLGGFDDEIGAAMYSPIEATKNWAQGKGFSIPESYRSLQQRMDARKAARRERYPVASTLGSIAGGLALGAGAMRAGLTTIGRLAPVKGAAVEGGLYGALYGAGEASPGERLKGAFTGGLVGAGTGALAGKIGQSIMNRGSSAQLQPAEAIKIQKNALYDASEKARVMIRPAPIKRAVQNLRLKMASQVKNERLYAETRDILQYLDAAASRGPMTLREVDELRQVVGDTIGSANLREKRTLGMVKSAIDDFLDNLSPKDATGATKEGVELLKQAREMNVVMSKQSIVEEIVENAKNQATGFENGLRVHFRALAKNPKKFGKFSKAEQDAIRKIIRGGPVENVLRAFAWFSPQKTLGAVFTGLTAAEGGMGPASAVAAGGMAATRLAEGATRKNVNALEMLIQGQGRRDLPLLARQAIPVLSGTASREMEQR